MSQWLKEVQCCVKRIEYDYDRYSGRLYMDDNNSCDMEGCIKLFRRIDPAVARIETFAGGKPDTLYKEVAGDWQAEIR